MGIPQHELGSVVIESTRGSFPITLLVTVCTGLAQCAFVLVILLVAGITIGWCILVHLALVAILAIDFVMLAKQWKLGFGVVEPGWILPTGFTVARSTIASQRLFVDIVFLVTLHALLRQLLTVQHPGMTVRTTHLSMLASQRILRVQVMVEGNVFPRSRTVTGLTLGSIPTFVLVVFLVAINASLRCVLESAIGMAVVTLDLRMLALQCKLCLFVVVITGLTPTHLTVAVRALASNAPFVNIILLVAAYAIGRCLPILAASRMALGAGHLDVLSFEEVVRLTVIKALGVKLNNFGLTTFVVSVATAAKRIAFQSTMKALFQLDVTAHLLVTSQTQCILPAGIEPFVAFAAFIFKLGMARDNITGGKHRLNGLSAPPRTPYRSHHAYQQREKQLPNRVFRGQLHGSVK